MPAELTRYEFVRRIGGGGMGDVFLAHKKGIGGFSKPVAVKLMRPDVATSPRAVELFLREGTVLAGLRHRNIVQVFELDHDQGALYLAMEYLEGTSLRALANAHGDRLPYRAVAWIAREIARGLHAAHTTTLPDAPDGVIHRDLSPSNVMTCSDGTVKILDFGLARPAGQMPSVSSVEGKLAYLAPESLAGVPLDGRADVYALGVIMYELLAGSLPFDGAGPLALVNAIDAGALVPLARHGVSVPSAMNDIVLRAMARDRGSRFASAKALEEALGAHVGTFDEDALRKMVAAATPSTTADAAPTQPAPRRSRRRAITLSVMLGAVAAIAGTITIAKDRGQTPERAAAERAAAASAATETVHTMPVVASPPAPSPEAVPASSTNGVGGAVPAPASQPVPPAATERVPASAHAVRASATERGPAAAAERRSKGTRDKTAKRTRASARPPSTARSKSPDATANPAAPPPRPQPAQPTGASPGTLLDPFPR